MDCIITYQKENGDILIRPCISTYGRKVGDETAMGWKVLDIHYKHNDNYYCYSDFMKIFRYGVEKEIKEKKSRKKKLIKYLIKELNKLEH